MKCNVLAITKHIFMSSQNGITQGFCIRRNTYGLFWNGSGLFAVFHFLIFKYLSEVTVHQCRVLVNLGCTKTVD